ncbi:Hypothetical protein CINCED_3A006717 [Cinara cedri]|nr:Hypothetical protein CINCED_3A006717 [Cinara cedri]
MENQNLMNMDIELSEHDSKTLFVDKNDVILSDEIKDKNKNDIDEHILMPDKIITAEKLLPLENTFEVIEQEFTTLHDNEAVEVTMISKDEEKEKILENDPMSTSKIEDLAIPLKTESPKESPKEELMVSEKLESKIDIIKTAISQENESIVQSEIKIDTPEVIPRVTSKKVTDEDVCDIKIGPDELFCRIGLDKWFNPEKLPPKVEALVYWRDPVSSGIVFGATLVVLLSFMYMSLISVVAYLAIVVQTGCIALRLYKTALQTVQKTTESHPFQEYLDMDIRLPQEKAEELGKLAVVHINAVLVELRRLLLAEDLVDSAKFFGILWVLTYVGALFNGLTLIIIGFVALFTLPKVYENNKTQIDQNIELVRSKIAELTNK